MTAYDLSRLRRNSLYAACDEACLSEAALSSGCRVVDLPAGALIRNQGDLCTEHLTILSGTISASFVTYDGRKMRVETISAPDSIGTAFLFSPDRRFPVQAEALTDVRLFEIDVNTLLQLCISERKMLAQLLSEMGRRTSFLARKLRAVQFGTLRERLAAYLLDELAIASGKVFTLRVSKKQLAEMLGVARQSLFRAIRELEEQSIIRCDGRRVTVQAPDRLLRFVRESD
jgi:CRP-like cAMP-binding protein